DLEAKAARNVLWTWYNGSRYWNAYKEAYNKYTFDVLLTSFMMGEAAATTIFTEMGEGAKIPQFQQVFKQISLDETRHYAFTHVLLQDNLPKMDESRKMMVTKQIRAGFVFLSLIMYKPPKDFWKLPRDYDEVHFKMEDLARDAGLGVPTLEQKEKAWRDAVLRVGAAVSKYGVKLPEIPELGINGEEVKDVSEDDIIPIF
ncbi:MAG: ferritin family protein, partial [Thermoprotei archaeon]